MMILMLARQWLIWTDRSGTASGLMDQRPGAPHVTNIHVRPAGGHSWLHRHDAGHRPRAVQAETGVQGRATDAAAGAAADLDRGRVGRCVALRGELGGALRDSFLAVEGDGSRDR